MEAYIRAEINLDSRKILEISRQSVFAKEPFFLSWEDLCLRVKNHVRGTWYTFVLLETWKIVVAENSEKLHSSNGLDRSDRSDRSHIDKIDQTYHMYQIAT